MTWYKVYKTYRNGKSEIDYFEIPKYSKKDSVEEIAITWAEKTPGGENYGWRVYWEGVKKPSKKWLKKEIKKIPTALIQHERKSNSLKNKLKKYQKLLGGDIL